MTEDTQGTIQIESSVEIRAGVFSDLVSVATKEGTTRIDFMLTDVPGSNPGDQYGVLSSRVFLSNETLLKLRDLLVRHTADWAIAEEHADAE